MRFTKLKINKWRNFNNIEIAIPKEATLVALIGENGAGKSSILDILNSASHLLGLSVGIDIPRGNPFEDEHDIRVDAIINRKIDTLLDKNQIEKYEELGLVFDGELSIITSKLEGIQNSKVVLTNFEDHPESTLFAYHIVDAMRSKEDTFHMSLDADRSYPPKPIQTHEYAQSLEQDWSGVGLKKNRAFVSSRNKYDEWMKYCVGTEAKRATEAYQAQRLAKANKNPPPEFVDQFQSYGEAIKNVLPHLSFLGVDTKEKTLIFNSTGKTLSFNQLSGGEREIAFVIGQIERFELKNGVLLIDEPELHLNPEMVRNWVSYLRDSVKDGQTWIATHSMEAVEAAGLDCTFVVERDSDTKKVNRITSLVDQPALSILSSAVGSPAFSIAKKSFVFIEGDRQGIERDKFYRLYGILEPILDIRFMEGGGCNDVVRKFEACKLLAESADEQLHVGGIVDRDFRAEMEISELSSKGVYILPFHEIENAFIYPPALQKVIDRTGSGINACELIKKVADKLSGKWILARAKYRANVSFDNQREISTFWSSINWDVISENWPDCINAPQPNCKNESDIDLFNHKIYESYLEYKSLRESKDLWTFCEGKQVLTALPSEIGFSKQIALINSVYMTLKENRNQAIELFGGIAGYIKTLTTA